MALPRYFKRIYGLWVLLLILIILVSISIFVNGSVPLKGLTLIFCLLTLLIMGPPIAFFMQITPEEFLPHGMKVVIYVFGYGFISVITILYLAINPLFLPKMEDIIGFPLFTMIFLVCFGGFAVVSWASLFSGDQSFVDALSKPMTIWLGFVATLIAMLEGFYLVLGVDYRSVAIALPALMWIPMLRHLDTFHKGLLEMTNMTRPATTNRANHPTVLFSRSAD